MTARRLAVASCSCLVLAWACGFDEVLLVRDSSTGTGGTGSATTAMGGGAGSGGDAGGESGGAAGSGGPGSGGASASGGASGASTLGTGGSSVGEAAHFDQLFLGSWSSCALLDQRPLCWGENGVGGLGVGDTEPRLVPDEVASVRRFTQVSIQGDHGCALEAETGNVFCWGAGDLGQLGTGQLSSSLIPLSVELAEPAVQVEAGVEHSCAILVSRQLWCWGNNAEGQLGQGTNNNRFASPIQVGTDEDWRDVSANSGHTCGIRGSEAGGAVYCWGRNTNAQIGQGATTPQQHRTPTQVGAATDWVDVQASQISSCAQNSAGELHCWGEDVGGSLGAPGTFLMVPTRVGSRSWDSFALGTFHTCALDAGELWCWGRNEGGQLGQGTVSDTEPALRLGLDSDWVSVRVGRFHTCGLRQSSAGERPDAFCVGNNGRGQLGLGDTQNRTELQPVASPTE